MENSVPLKIKTRLSSVQVESGHVCLLSSVVSVQLGARMGVCPLHVPTSMYNLLICAFSMFVYVREEFVICPGYGAVVDFCKE